MAFTHKMGPTERSSPAPFRGRRATLKIGRHQGGGYNRSTSRTHHGPELFLSGYEYIFDPPERVRAATMYRGMDLSLWGGGFTIGRHVSGEVFVEGWERKREGSEGGGVREK